jgi:plasmid stabilization system protein ParE
MKVVFRPEAEDELIEAIEWYEERGNGLGAEFLSCVDACVLRILKTPEIYPVAYRDVRMGLTRKFPYLVLYRVLPDAISVIAVFHAKRDPKIWKGR